MKRCGCLGCMLLVGALVLLALVTCRFFGLPVAPQPDAAPGVEAAEVLHRSVR